jgi:hypothetical protein
MPTVILKHTASGEYRDRILIATGATPPAGFTYEPDTQPNRDAWVLYRLSQDAAASEGLRAAARHFLVSGREPWLVVDRGLFYVVLDEVNALRQWIADFKTQTAASTSYADLKARVATLPNMPQRTAQQGLNAIIAKIDTGSAD